MAKRELVFHHPKNGTLDRYFSVETSGKLLTIRESRLTQRDDPKRGTTTCTNMPSEQSAAAAFRAQIDYRLGRGYEDLVSPAAAAAEPRASKLRQWVDGLDESWRRFFLEGLPANAKAADTALKKILATKTLDLCTRQLTTLAPLARFTDLRSINASGNPKLADFRGLENHKKLGTLWLAGTGARSLMDFPALGELAELSVAGTAVRDLRGIERYTKLAILDVSKTRVSSLAPLACVGKLRKLELNQTKVKDLSPLAGAKKLEELRFFMTPVADVSPLASLRGLTSIIASKTNIRSVMPLAALPKLRSLVVVGTKLSAAEKAAFEKAKKGVLKQRGT